MNASLSVHSLAGLAPAALVPTATSVSMVRTSWFTAVLVAGSW